MKNNFVYIMSNWNNKVIYVGVTSQLEKRGWQHKKEIFEGFSKKYKTKKLVYFEQTNNMHVAIGREKQIKNWRRDKKEFLINQINPDWEDLSEEWYQDPSASLGMTESI